MRIGNMEAGQGLAEMRQLNSMKRERDALYRELERMYHRREELESRVVKREDRKRRFIARLDGEIRERRERVGLLEANIAGMEAEG